MTILGTIVTHVWGNILLNMGDSWLGAIDNRTIDGPIILISFLMRRPGQRHIIIYGLRKYNHVYSYIFLIG